jgi:hypothetical protein
LFRSPDDNSLGRSAAPLALRVAWMLAEQSGRTVIVRDDDGAVHRRVEARPKIGQVLLKRG